MLIFDLETNGLLPEVTKIWTMSIYDTVTGRGRKYDKNDVALGLAQLEKAEEICGHNIIGYDLPVIRKLCPGLKITAKVYDTLIMSKLVFPNVGDYDFARFRRGTMPGKLIGRYSLEAWGYRLGELKGEYGKQENAWNKWSPEMSDYCYQDVMVTKRLWERMSTEAIPWEAVELEQRVAKIIVRQEMRGFKFDLGKAAKLHQRLLEDRLKVTEELRAVLPEFWYAPGGRFVPKADNKRFGYTKGAAMTKLKLVEFNPNSSSHIARFFTKQYGWKPEEFTEKTGEPVISEEVLDALEYPEAKLFSKYMTITKRLGQLADGAQAWLKKVGPDDRIHGGVNTLGAVTRRMTHHDPNLAQVPASHSLYGPECRELFTVLTDFKLVGCDAAGLEARCLAHFLAMFDGGAYIKTVIEGRKEDGTDVHTVNMRALGITDRDVAKTFFYAWMYGAGIGKIAKILGCTEDEAKKVMNRFMKAIPAFKKLREWVAEQCKEGSLTALDGAKLHVRSPHSALNTLLQSAGALIMKKALAILDRELQEYGLIPGVDYEFVANVHDEWQIEVIDFMDDHGHWYPDVVGQMAKDAIRKAGEHFKFNCPLDGEYSIGNSWKETH